MGPLICASALTPLLTEDVQYQKLGLVVTDEQHRFGVNQRAALSQKAEDPHMLVLSATPIPGPWPW